jgi:nucleoside 2-deoxyribosyltransferase
MTGEDAILQAVADFLEHGGSTDGILRSFWFASRCPHCGVGNLDDDALCTNCGEKSMNPSDVEISTRSPIMGRPAPEKKMAVVYIAGPFRARTAWGFAENIRAAERLGLEVTRLGMMPLIPHANTAHFHGELPDKFFLDGTMELLRRCDAVMLTPNWATSSGARDEVDEAERLKIPVFVNVFDLAKHFDRQDAVTKVEIAR